MDGCPKSEEIPWGEKDVLHVHMEGMDEWMDEWKVSMVYTFFLASLMIYMDLHVDFCNLWCKAFGLHKVFIGSGTAGRRSYLTKVSLFSLRDSL